MGGTNGTSGAAALAIVHDIPGRLRLRLPAGSPTAGVTEALTRMSGVADCRWSPRTRSLLVRYEPGTVAPSAIAEAVATGAGVSLAPTGGATAPAAGQPPLAVAARDGVAALDRRVAEATGGLIGLRTLVPLGLTVWAITEILRGRAAPLAWSSALWYAHGLFRDYNVPGADA